MGRFGEWLGLSDWRATAALIGCIVFVALLLGALPRWLHSREASDYRGAVTQTAPGIVSTVTISPISQGGGSLFNAVAVTFAGHTAYYALPPQSRWKPVYGQPVSVTYQIGRQSGLVRVDSVSPIPENRSSQRADHLHTGGTVPAGATGDKR